MAGSVTGRRGAAIAAVSALAFGMASGVALAEENFPTRPITVVMQAPAGGATDLGTRAMLELMREHLGDDVTITVQDMSGAGGLQALNYVFTQPADGYTWLGANDTLEAYPMMGRTDYTTDDLDFWMSGGTSAVLVVPASAGISTYEEWVAWVEENPDGLSAATTPSGSLWDATATYLLDASGLDFEIVNYAGGGPATRSVLADETDFGIIGMTPLVPFIEAGELIPLVTWTPVDWEVAGTTVPSITRFIEGDRMLERTLPWTNIHGIATIKGVPDAVKERITAAHRYAMEHERIREVYDAQAFFPIQVSGEEASDLMRTRTEFQAWILEVLDRKSVV